MRTDMHNDSDIPRIALRTTRNSGHVGTFRLAERHAEVRGGSKAHRAHELLTQNAGTSGSDGRSFTNVALHWTRVKLLPYGKITPASDNNCRSH